MHEDTFYTRLSCCNAGARYDMQKDFLRWGTHGSETREGGGNIKNTKVSAGGGQQPSNNASLSRQSRGQFREKLIQSSSVAIPR